MKVKIFLAALLFGGLIAVSTASAATTSNPVYAVPASPTIVPSGNSNSSNSTGSTNTQPNTIVPNNGTNTQPSVLPPNPDQATTPTNPSAPTSPAVNPLMNMPISQMPDGTLVRVDGSMTVFMVHGSVLMPFTSAAIFLANGLKFSDVLVLPSSAFQGTTIGNMVGIRDGVLMKGTNDPTVFFIHNGQRLGIPSIEMFNQRGFSFKDVVVVADQDLQNIPSGGILQ